MSAPSPTPPPRSEWVLADCPACGKTMKLRRNMVGKHALLCPSCKAPIAIDFPEEEPVEPPPAQPPPPPPVPEPAPVPAPVAVPEKPVPEPTKILPRIPEPKVTLPNRKRQLPTHPLEHVDRPAEPVSFSGSTESKTQLPKPRKEIPDKEPTFRSTPLPAAKPPDRPSTKRPPVAMDPEFGKPLSSTRDRAADKKPEKQESKPNEPKSETPSSESENSGSQEFFGKLRAIASETLGKLKRRKAPTGPRLADWDTPNLESIPRAEIRADHWVEPGPDILPAGLIPGLDRAVDTATASSSEVPAGDAEEKTGGVRKKRKERRKLVRGIQALFLGFSGPVRWGLLLLISLIFGGGIWFLVRTFHHRAVASASEPTASKIEGMARDQAEQLEFLTLADMDESRKAVRRFLLADGWEAKSKFVRRPEKVRPLMAQWYVRHPAGPQASEDSDNFRKNIVGKSCFIFLVMVVESNDRKMGRFFAVEQIPAADPTEPSTYLVDWEVSVGYQPMELRDYKAKQPKEPMVFRVLVKPDVYPNYGFEDQNVWLCYSLTYPGDPDFLLYGYVKRGTPLETQLQQQLFKESNIMLQVSYPEEAISRDQVEIQKIIHPSWFYDREEALAPSTP